MEELTTGCASRSEGGCRDTPRGARRRWRPGSMYPDSRGAVGGRRPQLPEGCVPTEGDDFSKFPLKTAKIQTAFLPQSICHAQHRTRTPTLPTSDRGDTVAGKLRVRSPPKDSPPSKKMINPPFRRLTDSAKYDTERIMDNVESQIRSRVDHFVNELSDLVRKAALEAVANALKGGGEGPAAAPAKAPAKRGRPAAAAKPAKAPKAAAPAPSKRKAGQKRSPDEIAKTTDKLLQYIGKNSGQRIEEIAKAIGHSTKELTLPIKKLLSEKKIAAKGEKRATRYFGAGK